VEGLLTRADIGLRDKTLWRMLYETAARISEVLSLDVAELNLSIHQARVRRKGGAADIIVWQTGTARLLPRLLEGRRTGPLFLTERPARLALPSADLDPGSGRARLSYRRAAQVFEEASGGWTLHQLRHSALTHAAEAGANTSTLPSDMRCTPGSSPSVRRNLGHGDKWHYPRIRGGQESGSNPASGGATYAW